MLVQCWEMAQSVKASATKPEGLRVLYLPTNPMPINSPLHLEFLREQ